MLSVLIADDERHVIELVRVTLEDESVEEVPATPDGSNGACDQREPAQEERQDKRWQDPGRSESKGERERGRGRVLPLLAAQLG